MPLYKCPGVDNFADMMKQHIGALATEHYSTSLSVEYPSGRSAIAQNLHLVFGPSNGQIDRVPDPELQEGLKNGAAKYSEKDVWSSRGQDGVWHRQHLRVRRSLFTPLRVAQGPDAGVHLMRVRTTKGINLVTMQPFTLVDDWTQPANSHRVLGFPWIGNTAFQEVSDSMMVFDPPVDGASPHEPVVVDEPRNELSSASTLS